VALFFTCGLLMGEWSLFQLLSSPSGVTAQGTFCVCVCRARLVGRKSLFHSLPFSFALSVCLSLLSDTDTRFRIVILLNLVYIGVLFFASLFERFVAPEMLSSFTIWFHFALVFLYYTYYRNLFLEIPSKSFTLCWLVCWFPLFLLLFCLSAG
jgi:hypothetical protein